MVWEFRLIDVNCECKNVKKLLLPFENGIHMRVYLNVYWRIGLFLYMLVFFYSIQHIKYSKMFSTIENHFPAERKRPEEWNTKNGSWVCKWHDCEYYFIYLFFSSFFSPIRCCACVCVCVNSNAIECQINDLFQRIFQSNTVLIENHCIRFKWNEFNRDLMKADFVLIVVFVPSLLQIKEVFCFSKKVNNLSESRQ